MTDDEPGGDPACWAHLFDNEAGITPAATDGEPERAAEAVVDLARLAGMAGEQGAVWTRQSDDLNVNLLVFAKGGGVDAHVNDDVDVLIVVVAGEGILDLDGRLRPLRAGQAVLVPKGVRRGIRSGSDPFAYLTCHRRRAGLWPARARKEPGP